MLPFAATSRRERTRSNDSPPSLNSRSNITLEYCNLQYLNYQVCSEGLECTCMNNILSEQDTRAVLDILVEQLGVEERQITPEARIEEDLGADSLLRVEIAMALEEHFNVTIADEKLDKISTVA